MSKENDLRYIYGARIHIHLIKWMANFTMENENVSWGDQVIIALGVNSSIFKFAKIYPGGLIVLVFSFCSHLTFDITLLLLSSLHRSHDHTV